MLSLIRGLLGGIIGGATVLGGLRAIERGERLPTQRVSELAAKGLDRLAASLGYQPALPQLIGAKGGEAGSQCPERGNANHLARCPSCGKRWYEHEGKGA